MPSLWLLVLVEMSAMAAIYGLLVLAVKRLCGRRLPPGLHAALWLLVMLRLAVPPIGAEHWSLYARLMPGDGLHAPGQAAGQLGKGKASPLPMNEAGSLKAAALQARAAGEYQGKREAGRSAEVFPRASGPTEPAAAAPMPLARAFSSVPAGWLRCLEVLWLMGMLIEGVRLVAAHLAFRRDVLAGAVPIADPRVLAIGEECRRRLRLRGPVRLLWTDRLRGPALYGPLRPRLLLPYPAEKGWTDEQLRFMLSHELAHLKRRDLEINGAVQLLLLIHWFNPLLRRFVRQMREDQELATDELALRRLNADGEALAYGRMLIDLAAAGGGYRSSRAGTLHMFASQSFIHRRIHMIAQFSSRRQTRFKLGLVVALVLAAVGWTLFSLPLRAEGEGADSASSYATSVDVNLNRANPVQLYAAAFGYRSGDYFGGLSFTYSADLKSRRATEEAKRIKEYAGIDPDGLDGQAVTVNRYALEGSFGSWDYAYIHIVSRGDGVEQRITGGYLSLAKRVLHGNIYEEETAYYPLVRQWTLREIAADEPDGDR